MTAAFGALLFVFCGLLTTSRCLGFLVVPSFVTATTRTTTEQQQRQHDCSSHVFRHNLIPISKFRSSECTFLNDDDDESSDNAYRYRFDKEGTLMIVGNNDGDETTTTTPPHYRLCLVQREDLPDLARFVINAFGADVISLSQDFGRFEKALLSPTIGLVNAYSSLVAYAEVLTGLQARTRHRLDDPNLNPPNLVGKTSDEQLQEAERTSLVLAVGRPSQGSDWHIDVVASVELRLEPCDAKIPFSFPLLDRIERRLGSLVGMKDDAPGRRELRPYLSNLCVDEAYRGKKLGKALVRCVEDITKSWGYSKLYLHVDLENEAALNLYQKANYRDVGKRWNPFWAGPAAKIGYLSKRLDNKNRRLRNKNMTMKAELPKGR